MKNQKKRICYRPPSELKPYKGNARTHSAKQVQQVAQSIQRFGFTAPLLIDGEGMVLAGHARLEAAKLLKLAEVPTICVDYLSDAEKKAYIVTDNRLAEISGWSKPLLAQELAAIIEIDPDFDLELTGFELGTIELLLDQDAGSRPAQDLLPPEPEAGPAVSRAGDLWQLGRHRLYCGDATEREGYQALLGRSRAQMVFTDPPYNVPVHGHISGLGKTRHREFVQASGEMSEAEFMTFLTSAFTQMAKASIDGSIHFVCMDWRHLFELQTAGRAAYDSLANICVWTKSNAGMGSLYRSQHELVAVYKRGTRSHINAVELGKHGRYRTNVWAYPGSNSFSIDRATQLAWHPTVKPLELVADAILDVSRRDGVVLDPFAGSGTTLLAAEQTGRQARLMELDPLYCDVIIRRFEAATGSPAVDHAGQTFAARSAAASLSMVGE
jgi:DNA modification methylase